MKSLSVIATNACGWPNLTKLPSGKVLCTYFNAPSHGLLEGDLVSSILNKNSIFEGRVRQVIVPKERSIDIDTLLDFEIAEHMIKKNEPKIVKK